MTGCLTRDCTSVTAFPVLRSYHWRLRSSVTTPSWTMRLPERSSGPTSPRFSCHRRIRAFSSWPMMMRASEPPMKWRLSITCSRLTDLGCIAILHLVQVTLQVFQIKYLEYRSQYLRNNFFVCSANHQRADPC